MRHVVCEGKKSYFVASAVKIYCGVAMDECGPYNMIIYPNSSPERTSSCTINECASLLNKLHTHSYHCASWPKFCTLEARLSSFDDWPISIKQRPEEITEAGFFYSGKGDKIVCFYCGGGLRDLLPVDNLWIEHARWFPECQFLIYEKGQDFVNSVCQKYRAIITAEDVNNIESPSSYHKEIAVANRKVECTPLHEEINGEKNNSNLCKICFQEYMNVLFLPCGHIVACVKCAFSMQSCAICRKSVSTTVTVFLS